MKKLLFTIIMGLLVATPAMADAFVADTSGPAIGTDAYCQLINIDSYFNGVTAQNPTGCYSRYNTTYHETHDRQPVPMSNDTVLYQNDLISVTVNRLTDLWGKPDELRAKLCVAQEPVACRPVFVQSVCQANDFSLVKSGMETAFVKAKLSRKARIALRNALNQLLQP